MGIEAAVGMVGMEMEMGIRIDAAMGMTGMETEMQMWFGFDDY